MKITEAFNKSLGGALLFATVHDIPKPGQHFRMIDKSYAKHDHIPYVRYGESDKVHVIRLGGTVLVESNRNPGRKTYPDNVIIKLLFKRPRMDRAHPAGYVPELDIAGVGNETIAIRIEG